MIYFAQEESSYSRYQGDEAQTLRLIADRYMQAQPRQPFVYRAYHRGGLVRESDYRYVFNMAERFPDMRDGQYVYAWAKLWCEQETEWAFSLSCYGPVSLFVNRKPAYKANIQEEVFPDRRSWFRLKLQAGWNHFVLQFVKTGTGCGCKFGTGSIKGLPMHFIMASAERDGQEGWLFSEPRDEALLPEQLPGAGTSEAGSGPDWLPRAGWTSDELASGVFGRLFGGEAGQVAYAWTRLIVPGADAAGEWTMSGRHDGAVAIYVDGRKLHAASGAGRFRLHLAVDPGQHELVMRSVSGGGRWDCELRLESAAGGSAAGLRLAAPYAVQGSSEQWFYLGPFAEGEKPDPASVCTMDAVFGGGADGRYWRVADQPDTVIRPYAESTHYGRWNYPLGVTLYGLLRAGDVLASRAMVDYVRDHIELCTSYDAYALWDRAQYGAAGCNHQLAAIDTLDDCGSFASVMLEAMKLGELRGARAAADRVAAYISHEQDRLPDGALYRVHGSTDFMQDTMWCDDLYMSTPFLRRYYELTGEARYLDDAAEQFMLYKKYLYMPERQVMSHVYDFKFNKQTGVPWGRGNGWVLFSLTELLEVLPADHGRRAELLTFYQELSEGYLALQDEQGMWHQVLDMPSSYAESSCTAMFVYAYARGVRFGWLSADPAMRERYVQAVLKGWQGLARIAVDASGNIYGVCRGSGYSYSPLYYKDDLTWNLNDTHGTGIIMLAGVETMLLRNWLEWGGEQL